jgi:ribonuclease HII
VLGLDEVGRGCVAGPIVAAAVFITKETITRLENRVMDSKKMAEIERYGLASYLRQNLVHNIAVRSADFVNKHGIQAANMDIFFELIVTCGRNNPQIMSLIDGTQAPKGLSVPVTTIKKGESLSVAIAAASIIAKSHRDAHMKALGQQWPAYGFENHKGYGTAQHTAALRKHGLLPGIHRTMFCTSLLS